MLEYYINDNSITIELAILSGGITVTGRTPNVLIRNKDTGNYFDFASRTFTGTTVSATAPLTSAIDGLYRTTWDVSGLFTTNTWLMFEYHDATSLAIDDVLFRSLPLVPSDVTVGGGGGSVTIKGTFNTKEKNRLFDALDEIRSDLKDFRQQAMMLIRGIFNRKPVTKEDILFLNKIKERDSIMWAELLKVLKLRDDTTTKEVLKKLKEYTDKEEKAKKEVLDLLKEKLDKPADIIYDSELENIEDDEDE